VVPAAKRRERECELAHRRAEGEIARLRDAVIDAHADGDERRAAQASKERDAAERTALRDSAERLEGARRAAARAEAEAGVFTRENIDGLLEEHELAARGAAGAVVDGLAQFINAVAAWNAAQAKIAALLRRAGRDAKDLPTLPAPLEQLARDARRADTRIPAPLPGQRAFLPVRSEEAA
jgi:hypothetical protein